MDEFTSDLLNTGYTKGIFDGVRHFAEWLENMNYLYKVEIDYDWDEEGLETVTGLTAEYVINQYLEHLKEDI